MRLSKSTTHVVLIDGYQYFPGLPNLYKQCRTLKAAQGEVARIMARRAKLDRQGAAYVKREYHVLSVEEYRATLGA